MIHKLDKGDLLDLDWLEEQLQQMPDAQIDILGGEPSLLSDDYARRLIQICTDKLGGKKPGVYSNLVKIPSFLPDVNLTVSYDPGSRAKGMAVLMNMLELTVPFEINMIVTRYVVAEGVENLLHFANSFKRLKQITLSTLTVFPGCEDLRPRPSDLARFCEDILRYDKKHQLRFYPINTWTEDYTKHMDPAQTVEILPNQKFRIALRDFSGVEEFDTYQEAAAYYTKNYAIATGPCDGCPYFRRCTHMYQDNKDVCIYDKKITRRILEAVHEYLPKL